MKARTLASFDIDPGSGQIRASTDLNHEDKSRHSLTVKATDTRGGSATVSVTINVTDITEPPDIPFGPKGDGGIEHERPGDLG